MRSTFPPLLLSVVLISVGSAGCHLFFPFRTVPPDSATPLDAGEGDGADGDAPLHDTSPKCPAQCDSCDTSTRTCTILESQNVKVTCPANWHCVLTCTGTDACRQGVDCSAAMSCDITCGGTGDDQCKTGAIVCGTGYCEITCSGKDSCLGEIDCSQSCACHLTCSGAGSCQGTTTCPAAVTCCPASCQCP